MYDGVAQFRRTGHAQSIDRPTEGQGSTAHNHRKTHLRKECVHLGISSPKGIVELEFESLRDFANAERFVNALACEKTVTPGVLISHPRVLWPVHKQRGHANLSLIQPLFEPVRAARKHSGSAHVFF